MPEKMSFSRIKAFWDCPTNYYILYIAGIKTPPTFPLINGSATHKCIQEMLSSPDPLNCSLTSGLKNAILKEAKGTDIKLDTENIYKCSTNAVKALYQRVPGLKIKEVENKFESFLSDGNNGWINKIKITGIIDCVVKGRDRGKGNPVYIMIDWKTTGNVSKAIVRYGMKMYRAQLALYKYFWSLESGIPVSEIKTSFGLIGLGGEVRWRDIRCSISFLEGIMREVNRSLSIMPISDLPYYNKEFIKCNYCFSRSICMESKR